VNKVRDFRHRFLAFEAILLFSDLVLPYCNIAMDFTSTLGHLCKMNDVTR